LAFADFCRRQKLEIPLAATAADCFSSAQKIKMLGKINFDFSIFFAPALTPPEKYSKKCAAEHFS